jgi:hypothetical protein
VSIANAKPVGQKCGVVYKGRKPCGRPAGAGTPHLGDGACAYHGGNLPNVKKAADARLTEFRVNRALAQFATPIVDADPEQTLLDLVAEAAGNVAFLGNQVRELAEKPMDDEASDFATTATGRPSTRPQTWSRTTGYSKGAHLFGPQIDVDKDGREHVVGELERGMVKLYGQWADRLAKYAKAALDAGIERRRVEMAERHGEQIVIVINNVLVQMGISGDELLRARSLVAEEFRQLATMGDG